MTVGAANGLEDGRELGEIDGFAVSCDDGPTVDRVVDFEVGREEGEALGDSVGPTEDFKDGYTLG